ncbi:hypothetical protein DPMN_050863 [Dreissena polymorpha]|uniref:Uncharacterized protein n=1 Tax=Dreissena polymorpha TaxID=45954 RepID=A0A9D4HMS1_DREPO|nr:hypothetical protein DPMN_050863 [Dreissena polymorpha]
MPRIIATESLSADHWNTLDTLCGVKNIIGKYVLRKFREDVTIDFLTKTRYYWDRPSDQFSLRSEINVAARVLKRNMLTTSDARQTTDKRRSQKLIMLCSGELKMSATFSS